ncbi:MAG: prefoldin subunit beta [Candidatus Woesearchaeota archaeon]|jgi:prefoldin beta subunit|nr:prefoldin subunit beta [Candidatus Woesearchaeota archaeon]MDP6139163.1 prefoldin subunit beta [Candidatus Woesearchaeota archaeon]MDP6265375.1 prefoldin subunit beta [Candidatus Woesearchaeota archaeon]MDP6600579.1 prefoldin subunit beta [Candidatus Woesearchaeota archaeon]MDP7322954.1 prefoldin subunit beta [Candidatus Woesearchaeota archaeon]|tara:strand:- start:728 stop:1063 length:336 start_codon:yes stop_codon:yes gene_type:complete
MAEVSKDSEKKLGQLQMLEQSMQNFLMQKQQFQLQQVEIESALKELEKVNEAYKIVGNIMVLSKKDDLIEDLKSKKEVIELRIKNMEKQESQLREKASKLQNEVLKEMGQD